MPEGDTIFRSAQTLHRALAGNTIESFRTVLAHLARVNDDTPLAGRVVERVESRGKHLLMFFSGDLILRTHMRMNGSWHLYRHGERWWRGERMMRVRIDTSNNSQPPLRAGMSVEVEVDTGHARGLPRFVTALFGGS